MHCLKCRAQLLKETHYGLHPACFTQWFKVESLAEFISLQRRSHSSSEDKQQPSNDTSFFHGMFKKYSAILNDESYILKMRQKDAPELPEVEYLCNQIASLLSIPVAEFYFIQFNSENTFVTKNFIRQGSPVSLQHIYHFRDNALHNCETLIKVVYEKTQNANDVRALINTILFDALIGNHDRHGRNLAFIATAKDVSLSPIYDNVSYLSLEYGDMLLADFNPTGKVHTSATLEPSMRDYVRELKELGYHDNVEEFYQRINLSQIAKLVDESFCSDLMKKAMNLLIKKRYLEIKNELAY